MDRLTADVFSHQVPTKRAFIHRALVVAGMAIGLALLVGAGQVQAFSVGNNPARDNRDMTLDGYQGTPNGGADAATAALVAPGDTLHYRTYFHSKGNSTNRVYVWMVLDMNDNIYGDSSLQETHTGGGSSYTQINDGQQVFSQHSRM